MVFAVIDTNVLVSYFVAKEDSPPVAVIREVLNGRIIPVFNDYLLDEYRAVLSRKKFGLGSSVVDSILRIIQSLGWHVETKESGIKLPDMKDAPIFDIALETRNVDTYLVTGNTKHYPKIDFVVTPKQMMRHLETVANE